MERTEEQQSICAAVASRTSTMVEALAGCAKSTTLVEALRDLPPGRSSAMIVFNKKAKEDLERKVKEARLACTIYTANGLGHRALLNSGIRPELDNDKIFRLAKAVGLRKDDLTDCMALVRAARMAGIVPSGLAGKGLLPDTVETWGELADDLLVDSILTAPARNILRQSTQEALRGLIDFDDQIYLTSCIFGAFPRFDTTFVDEAQDLSRLNHEQIRKCSRDQIVAVGDSHQAIYAWRGADSNSMANLRGLRDTWSDQTLSLTFRCPRAVVERQREFVPLFRAGPDNLEGTVRVLKDWSPSGASAAVLCRNNAPLIRLAFRLLRARVPCNLLGRDIGREMKRLYNKVSRHGKRSIPDTIDEAKRLMAEDEKKAERYDSLVAVLENTRNVEELETFLAASKNAIILATGHKAKGLEWDRVYHLEPGLIPSIWAKTEEELQQERNLRYVIETRTRNELFFVRMENLQ